MQQSPPAPGAPPRVPLLSCRGLLIGYEKPIVPPIDLDMYENDLWAVVGINGSGKSTWMRTALGLERPLGGTVTLSPGTRVAYVPQAAALDPIYPIRVCDVVLMGLMKPGRVGGFLRQGDRELAREALAKVRAEALYFRPFRDLSGGQRQRVLIARALASKAQVFFLDEPTSALDRPAEEQVLELIDDLQRIPGAAVALITHHLQVLRGIADHALLVDRESNSVMAGTADEVSHSPLFHRLFGDAIGTWPTAARKP